ncbi:MAG: outer membrane beta-barrel protein [Bacteroidota bacterium]
MKKLFLVQVLIGCAVVAFGQAGKLKAVVYDSTTKTPLELATVSLFNQDSSLLTYQLSDKNGTVSFEKLALKKKVLISISYVGYNTYSSLLQLTGKDSIRVLLSLNTTDTSSVTITTKIPVRMNGDTLEINPAAFKLKEHQVVEELLNQVPGMTVWSDGSITVSGRKVQNVFVDGKPFAGSTDPRIATQNLPKSAIDKIQLYQEYDRANIGQEGRQQADSILSMNIKLKESAKKGYFGKGGGGYGTDNRFESDLVMQTYNKKSSIGIGGGYNNINKDIGSLEQMMQNNTYRTTNPDLTRVGRFGASGINKNHSVGVSLTQNFSESNNSRQNNRLTVNYHKNGGDSWVTNLRTQNRIVAGSEQLIKEEGQQNNRSNNHTVSLNYAKTNTYNDNLNLGGTASFRDGNGISSSHSETADALGSLQSTNDIFTRQTDRSDNQSMNLSFGRNDFDRPLTNINLSANMQRSHSSSERNVISVFKSMTVNNKDTSYNRRYLNNNQTFGARANLVYGGFKRLLFGRYNLGGIDLRLEQAFNYNQTTSSSQVSDFDKSAQNYTANKNLSNENDRKTISYVPTLNVTKSFSRSRSSTYRNINLQARFMEDIRSEKNVSTIAWRNLDRVFHFFRYEAGLNFFTFDSKKNNYNVSLNYNKNFDYPSIDALYTIVDDINAYNVTVGNPALKNRINHSLGLYGSFNTQNPQSPYAINANINAGYNLSQNPVTDSVINAPSGKRTSYYINADRSDDLYMNYSMNISKRIKKNTLQLMYNGNFNSGNQPNYIDGIYNLSKSSRLSNQLSLRFSLASILVVSIAERLEYNQVGQTVSKLNNFTNSSNTTNISVNLNYPKDVSFGSTLDHINNSSLDKPTILWNAFATCRIMKQQGELKLAAMDILKQYRNIFNSVSAYGTSTSITNGLQQYFMLTFAYYPRKFGKRAGEVKGE